MELKEAERIVVAKPVASRPTLSNFKSFSEFFPPTSEPLITVIRPKTVRFKPVTSSPLDRVSSQAELPVTQACHSSDKILKSNHTSPLLYRPLAKTVSKATIHMLANMGTCNASNEHAVAQNAESQPEMVKGINLPNVTPVKSGNDKRPQLYKNNIDRPSYDGYNWRKYGQKQVKGSEYPRSYYKCTHPNCLVKKKVERSLDGEIAEIVYKGDHNHVKPRLPRRHAFDGTNQESNRQLPNNQINDTNEHLGSSSHLNDLVKVQESYNHVSNEAFNTGIPKFDCSCGVARVQDGSSKVIMERVDDIPAIKRRKGLNQSNETFVGGLQVPQVVHDGPDSEAVSDGFRWRKYGQKVVRGNPYPRSYYKCTVVKCNVRKHVERAADNPNIFITTYEVIEAANGFQAWKILQNLSNHIDLVLTEVVMPSLSGIGLLCKIMSHKTRKNVPVIMMSSHDSMGLVFKCLSKGAVDFLVKPIRKNELKNLWQHVWRRCHSSSGSGSESGTQAQKSVNSKSNLRHDNSCSRDGDDDESADGGSDTQSSWTKQAVDCESPEAASPCDQIAEHPDSTCGLVIRPVRDYNDQSEQPFTDDGGKAKEIAISISRNSEMQVEFPTEAPTKDNGINQNSYMENGKTDNQGVPEKIMEENIKVTDDPNGVIAGEPGLKRPRATDNDGGEVQNVCHILRHSELSAFTRYKTKTNAANVTTGITASCSQPANISNIVKNESKRDTHSDGYLIYQGSSEQVIPRKDDDDMAPQELRIQHIHHHHHVHHYHNIDTDQQLSNQNDFGLNDLGADAPHCGSSNIMGGPVEGNLENYSLNKSGSGSKHGSCNVQNGSNTAVNIEGTNVESNVDIVEKSGSGGNGSGNNSHKSAQREAALTKFRKKREVRCFQKKVRYQNRKKLAEQRPRVRGQFVKGTNREGSNSANAADV